ncbi:hypothetical protein [Lederbergia citrea]|nr:hypothetical protein [Lederbergia citrea]MBS4178026.1 hypothetical protein [Lederbergia citrea]
MKCFDFEEWLSERSIGEMKAIAYPFDHRRLAGLLLESAELIIKLAGLC